MTSFRKLTFVFLALPTLFLVLWAGPSAATIRNVPEQHEPCGVSGRCGETPPDYVKIQHPEGD